MNPLITLTSPPAQQTLFSSIGSALLDGDKLFSAFMEKVDKALSAKDLSKFHVPGPLLTGGWEPNLAE